MKSLLRSQTFLCYSDTCRIIFHFWGDLIISDTLSRWISTIWSCRHCWVLQRDWQVLGPIRSSVAGKEFCGWFLVHDECVVSLSLFSRTITDKIFSVYNRFLFNIISTPSISIFIQTQKSPKKQKHDGSHGVFFPAVLGWTVLSWHCDMNHSLLILNWMWNDSSLFFTSFGSMLNINCNTTNS